MFFYKLTICAVLFGRSLEFPSALTRVPGKLYRFLSPVGKGDDYGYHKGVFIPTKLNGYDTSEHDRDSSDVYRTGYAPGEIDKRSPWYRSFYDDSKRLGSFDSINHYSDFGTFQKKRYGNPDKVLGQRQNPIRTPAFDHVSDFGRFSKRFITADRPAWKRPALDYSELSELWQR